LIQNSDNTVGFAVRVSAKNVEGWKSVSTKAISLKPMGVPLATTYAEVLRAAGSDNSLILYWAFIPFSDDRASPVNNFTIEWSLDDSFDQRSSVNLEAQSSIDEDRLHDSAGRSILSYNISNLKSGQNYYIRVAGINSMGIGAWKTAEFIDEGTTSIAPYDKPDVIPYGSVRINTIPASDSVSVLESCSSIKVAFNSPTNIHGSLISTYLIEWYDNIVTPEVQTIEVSSIHELIGSFRLLYNGSRTDYIPVNANEDNIRNELE
jgi:hypothetical protein